ncbi:MAG: hypothetical protein OXG58_03570 [Gemmatimonadetes bacterium]|nr:hypothetical protein [Gemmatimonadota bacterium]MCY3942496.1 hypothetical protein [Gemmatimonadota bacterium]
MHCDEPNRPPASNGIIPGDSVEAGESVRVNVTDFFHDPDSLDVLVYTAESADESRVAVEMDGPELTYTGVAAPGDSKITVTATDPGGLSAADIWIVAVVEEG